MTTQPTPQPLEASTAIKAVIALHKCVHDAQHGMYDAQKKLFALHEELHFYSASLPVATQLNEKLQNHIPDPDRHAPLDRVEAVLVTITDLLDMLVISTHKVPAQDAEEGYEIRLEKEDMAYSKHLVDTLMRQVLALSPTLSN